MSIPFIAASAALSAAALFDGITTVRFLKSPKYEEQNPLFGKRPSAFRVYDEGGAIIAAEILLGFLLSHVFVLGYLVVAGFGVQSFIHIRNGIRNLRLPI